MKYLSLVITTILLAVLYLNTGFCSQDIEPDMPIIGTPVTLKEALDLLTAFGCLPIHLKGDALKPEAEVVRLLRQASLCDDNPDLPSYIRHLIKKARDQFEPNVKKSRERWWTIHLRKPRFYLQYLYYRDDSHPLPRRTTIDATTSPWTAYREGINFAPNHNGLLGGEWGFSYGPWFDFSIESIFLTTQNDSASMKVLRGNTKLTFGNFEIKVGRSHMYWGQGHYTGAGTVLFGNNNLPLEMIQIGSPHPLILPWIFKYLGPFQYRLSLANLDKNQRFPNPYLFSGRIMFKPTSNLEFGLTRSLVFGGTGSPSFFFLEPILELFGFRPRDGWIFNIPVKPGAHSTSGFANNVFGFDFLWKFPSLRNSELFFELYNEDPFDYKDFFPEDSIFRLGLWVPRLKTSGDLQLLVEASYAARIVYTHGIFTDGFVNQGRIMGLDSGAKTIRFYARLNKLFFPHSSLWGSTEVIIAFPLSDTGPLKEYRTLVRAGGTRLISDHFRVNASVGVQVIKNFNFMNEIKISPMIDIVLDYSF